MNFYFGFILYLFERKSMVFLIKNVICVNYIYFIFKIFFDLINMFKKYNVLFGMEKDLEVFEYNVVNVMF